MRWIHRGALFAAALVSWPAITTAQAFDDSPTALRVRFRTDAPSLRLYAADADDRAMFVCSAPCGKLVETRRLELYFDGELVPRSPPLDLGPFMARPPGEIRVDVHAGSYGLRAGGIALIVMSPLVFFGAWTLAFFAAPDAEERASTRGSNTASTALLVGGGTLSLGLIASGVVLLVASRTTVTMHRAPAAPRATSALRVGPGGLSLAL